MARIMVVDDEERIRTILNIMLSSQGHKVVECASGNEALSHLESDPPDLVITDIRMDGLNGVGLLKAIHERDLGCPVVFVTAYASLDSAIEALRLGAVDYLVKPFEEEQVLVAVERALGVGRIMAENIRLREAISKKEEEFAPVFVSQSMKEVQQSALKVASANTTVLIMGETGSGKEVVARFIHSLSPLCKQRFVAVNCAAIAPGLLESELFGHERGAFTGANRTRVGKFEFADGGTLFLDEVGDLSMEAQAKVLRAIQEKTIQRVGGNRDIAVNVRLICATHYDLKRQVEEGKFRKDLYYRIAVYPIHVPPLRERKEDIVPLACHFIKRLARVREMKKGMLTPGAAKMLEVYPWPGNVRELANAIERALIAKGGCLPITSDDLGFLTRESAGAQSPEELFRLPPTGIEFDRLQRHIIRQALEMTSGNQSAAARLLGLTRSRFRTLLKLLEEGKM